MSTTSINTPNNTSFFFFLISVNDVSSPYYLHSSDHPGAIFVSNILVANNYVTWQRAMKIALNAKNKVGFIGGTFQRPTTNYVGRKIWERCNDMVISWMLNGIEQNLASNLTYCDTPKSL